MPWTHKRIRLRFRLLKTYWKPLKRDFFNTAKDISRRIHPEGGSGGGGWAKKRDRLESRPLEIRVLQDYFVMTFAISRTLLE